MAKHVDLDDELKQTWEASHYGNQYTGPLSIDYSDVTWEHRAYMNNASRTRKVVTEDVSSKSPLDEMHEYFSATTDMFESFKMNAPNFKTEACISIKPQNRLPKLDNSGQPSLEEGFPDEISFPHIGKKTIHELSQTPLPSSTDEGQMRVVYEHITVNADLKMHTFFKGNVTISQGSSMTDDINDHLNSAGFMKKSNNGSLYFESKGKIEIQVRRVQQPN